MATPRNNLSPVAARNLEEFDTAFTDALMQSAEAPWATEVGHSVNSDAIKTTFPLPISAAGYKLLEGEIKYRSLYSREMSMVPKEYSDGVAEKASIIENDAFGGWASQPEAMAVAWQNLRNDLTAAMLKANPLLDLYRDPDSKAASTINLFHGSHLANVLDPDSDTFDNDLSAAEADITSGALFKALSVHFAAIPGANGRPLGLMMAGGTIVVPPALGEEFKDGLENEELIRAITEANANVGGVTIKNRFKNYVKLIIAPELLDDDVVYAFSRPKPGLYAFATQQGTLEQIMNDRDSEMYKKFLKIGVAYHGVATVGAAMPHCVARVTIS